MISFFILISLAFIFASCANKPVDNDIAIARVYDECLYLSSIQGTMPENMSETDSARYVSEYINTWILNEVISQNVKANVCEKEKSSIEALTKSYEQSLCRHSFHTNLIADAAITVTDDEIRAYYNDNQDDFILPEGIIKTDYIVLSSSNYQYSSFFKNKFLSGKEKDIQQLKEYCSNYAIISNFDSEWYTINKFNNSTPDNLQIRESKLMEGEFFFDMKNAERRYIIHIKDYISSNNISPIEYVYDNIKNTLTNKKKNEIIKEAEDKLYNKAIKENAIEIFR